MKKILVVDDSPIVQAAARLTLDEAGFEVAVRSTWEEMLAQPIEGYDLILMDVQMPELFGDDVAAVLRHERGVKTPIYLWSSLPAAELARLCDEQGLDGYIEKGEDLAVRVRAILGPDQ